MAFIVYVKTVSYCVIFKVCYETSDVNGGH